MGKLHRYICPACNYHAEVSGGEDATFATVVCFDCQKLYDVVTTPAEPPAHAESGDAPPEKPRPVKFRCPKRSSHKIARWKNGDACPQCGSTMIDKGPVATWD